MTVNVIIENIILVWLWHVECLECLEETVTRSVEYFCLSLFSCPLVASEQGLTMKMCTGLCCPMTY